MAVVPLFFPNKEAVLSRMRLSNSVDSGAIAVIDSAIQQARQWLQVKLGIDNISTVLGYTVSDNPSTNEEICRGAATMAEEHYIRYILYRTLPALFLDDVGERFRKMNDELGHSPDGLAEARENELQSAIESVGLCLQLISSTDMSPGVRSSVIGGTSGVELGSTLGLSRRGGLL